MLPFAPIQLPDELRDPHVLEAMDRVPREEFVPRHLLDQAQQDVALPIGHGQTISQPLVVAWMTAALHIGPGSKVLEIGTGSGYQTAILAALGADVWTVEVVPALAQLARERLSKLGLGGRVRFRVGDGRHGWPGLRDFDGVLCAAAPATLPPALLDALALGGRLVIPIGTGDSQLLRRYRRMEDGITEETLLPVRFVPLVTASPSA